MQANTNLSRELAIALLKGQPVMCPACAKAALAPRSAHKNFTTRYVCPSCKTAYRPAKLI